MSITQAYQELFLVAPDEVIQLQWNFPPTNSTTLLTRNNINATATGCAIILPNATLAQQISQVALIYNSGTEAFDLQLFGGIDFIPNFEPGQFFEISLTDTSTPIGVWSSTLYGGGAVNISNFTIASDDPASIIVENGVVTNNGQVVTIKQPVNLQGFANPAPGNLVDPGFVVFDNSAPGNPVYKSVVLTTDSNVEITNPDGTAGNPIVGLNPVISGLTSLGVGDITLTTNTIATTGNDLVLSTGGVSGNVNTNGVLADVAGNLIVAGTTFANGGISSPPIPIAWIRFTDTTAGDTNVISVQDSFNATIVAAVTGDGGSYTITMPNPASDIKYGVQCSAGTSSISTAPLFAQAIYGTATSSVFTLIVTDSGGTIVSEVPNSLVVTVFSSSGNAASGADARRNYASLYMSANATPTTAITDTYTLIEGTTTLRSARNFTMPLPNKLLYVGTRPIASATIRVSASSTPVGENPYYKIGIFKNDILITPDQSQAPVGGYPSAITAEVSTAFVTNDFISIKIASSESSPVAWITTDMNVTIEELY